jgi:hypothetical protein
VRQRGLTRWPPGLEVCHSVEWVLLTDDFDHGG